MQDRRSFLTSSFLAAGAVACNGLSANASRELPSLVPETPAESLSYFNTWHSQYSFAAHRLGAKDFAAMMGDAGSELARDAINEENLFGAAGLVTTSYPDVRRDLYFVLDHGWDLPLSGDLKYTGLLELDPDRFPSFRGLPVERLRSLCVSIRKHGWKGVGVWVPAQIAPVVLERGKAKGLDTSSAAYERAYWIGQVQAAQAAGISYWKVDWGKRDRDPLFREMLYKIAREHAPNLVLETTVPRGPLNEQRTHCECADSEESKRDRQWIDQAHRMMRMEGAFRVYDSITFTGVSTTLARIAGLLQITPGEDLKAFINSEDEAYIGAALGCALGVLRNTIPGIAYTADPSPRHFGNKVNEAVRAARWQRFAPPVAAGETPLAVDQKVLWDSWKYSEGQTWLRDVIGKEVWQGAPARIARGMDLPVVRASGEPPFVVSSRHPNGATAVASIGRISTNRGWWTPRASVSIGGCPPDAPVAIFGRYKQLEIEFGSSISNRHVIAQDLSANTATDITHLVRRQKDRITLSGSLIDSLCASSKASKDESEPGIVLKMM